MSGDSSSRREIYKPTSKIAEHPSYKSHRSSPKDEAPSSKPVISTCVLDILDIPSRYYTHLNPGIIPNLHQQLDSSNISYLWWSNILYIDFYLSSVSVKHQMMMNVCSPLSHGCGLQDRGLVICVKVPFTSRKISR